MVNGRPETPSRKAKVAAALAADEAARSAAGTRVSMIRSSAARRLTGVPPFVAAHRQQWHLAQFAHDVVAEQPTDGAEHHMRRRSVAEAPEEEAERQLEQQADGDRGRELRQVGEGADDDEGRPAPEETGDEEQPDIDGGSHRHVLDPRHQRDRAEPEDRREQTGEQADKRGRAAAVDEAGGDHEERDDHDTGVPRHMERHPRKQLASTMRSAKIATSSMSRRVNDQKTCSVDADAEFRDIAHPVPPVEVWDTTLTVPPVAEIEDQLVADLRGRELETTVVAQGHAEHVEACESLDAGRLEHRANGRALLLLAIGRHCGLRKAARRPA